MRKGPARPGHLRCQNQPKPLGFPQARAQADAGVLLSNSLNQSACMKNREDRPPAGVATTPWSFRFGRQSTSVYPALQKYTLKCLWAILRGRLVTRWFGIHTGALEKQVNVSLIKPPQVFMSWVYPVGLEIASAAD